MLNPASELEVRRSPGGFHSVPHAMRSIIIRATGLELGCRTRLQVRYKWKPSPKSLTPVRSSGSTSLLESLYFRTCSAALGTAADQMHCGRTSEPGLRGWTRLRRDVEGLVLLCPCIFITGAVSTVKDTVPAASVTLHTAASAYAVLPPGGLVSSSVASTTPAVSPRCLLCMSGFLAASLKSSTVPMYTSLAAAQAYASYALVRIPNRAAGNRTYVSSPLEIEH
ncbi:hypothetical protein BV20DRAFT_509654 [Pilatotrama ljubarskyi]|nr:hypothetical protein BV20DRAFT_509654 [Pilatotrama ljubarskyi]